MVVLGLILIVVAAVLLIAAAHLATGAVIASGAVVAFACGVSLLLIGTSAGVLTAVVVSGAMAVASTGGLVMILRRLGPTRPTRPGSGSEAMIDHLGVVPASDGGSGRHHAQ
jgi:membrane-bound ClpP family serine protease